VTDLLHGRHERREWSSCWCCSRRGLPEWISRRRLNCSVKRKRRLCWWGYRGHSRKGCSEVERGVNLEHQRMNNKIIFSDFHNQ